MTLNAMNWKRKQEQQPEQINPLTLQVWNLQLLVGRSPLEGPLNCRIFLTCCPAALKVRLFFGASRKIFFVDCVSTKQ